MEILLGSFHSQFLSAFFDVKMNKHFRVSVFSDDLSAFTFWVNKFTNSALRLPDSQNEGRHPSNRRIASYPAKQKRVSASQKT